MIKQYNTGVTIALTSLNAIAKELHGNDFNNDRVIGEALKTLMLGVVNTRTSFLFNPIVDDYESVALDILTLGKMDFPYWEMRDKVNPILTTIKRIIGELTYNSDCEYTIWEVEVNPFNGLATIIDAGDYRIEQWHLEKNVVKTTSYCVVQVDISRFINFVKKKIDYDSRPANTDDWSGKKSKADTFKYLIHGLLSIFVLDETSKYEPTVAVIEEFVGAGHGDDIYAEIETIYLIDFRKPIEKASGGRGATSYILEGDAITINVGEPTKARTAQEYRDIELRLSEQRGDYIPERMRR